MPADRSPAGTTTAETPDPVRAIPGSIALVHEWLDVLAGSEQTFIRMANVLPQAELFALTCSEVVARALPRPVTTTALQRSRFLTQHRGVTLPVMPLAWRALRPPEFDLVITSSHAFSRCFPVDGARHLSYVYTPMRYAWMPEVDGRGASRTLAPARWALRQLDLRTTRSVTSFAGISSTVAQRIREWYRRDAVVIHPPVDLARFAPAATPRAGFLLGFSRWVPYKRLDLVIEVGERLDLPVVIAGRGPDEDGLRRRAETASVPVRIVHSPSDDELRHLYQTCEVLVFPAEEDFGIVPVEAQACGTKVVALGRGGSLDTVVDHESGVLAADQSAAALAEATRTALELGDRSEACQASAARFSAEVFDRRFAAWVADG